MANSVNIDIDSALDRQKKASEKFINCVENETKHGEMRISLFVRSVKGENERKRNNNRNIQ